MNGPGTMSHPALWTCPACGRPLTVALNPVGGAAGAHRPLEISRASAAAHACAPAARFPQFHSASSSSISGYEPASCQPWQPPVSAGAEDDEGVISQSEYTLTKPSSCPNHRDHVKHRLRGPVGLLLRLALHRLSEQVHPGFPVTIYYAFKQSETKGDTGTASTGWETFLDAVIRSGFAITGTWPMRTELGNRMRGMDSNALASSIVLVCRRRPAAAPAATRRDFLTALRSELLHALHLLQTGNVAPVDLAQAAIGPGMAVFTRYAKVLDVAGKPMSVREALALINQILDEVLAEQEGDFDADSRWALAWYGVAETLSKAKNTSVAGMVNAGILASQGGKVRLFEPGELPDDWDPTADARLTAWEAVHHLIHVLETRGETGAAALAATLGGTAETARELCYRLYTLCERKKRGRGAVVQRPRAELAGDLSPGEIRAGRADGAVRQ